jgi:hypothetical protein
MTIDEQDQWRMDVGMSPRVIRVYGSTLASETLTNANQRMLFSHHDQCVTVVHNCIGAMLVQARSIPSRSLVPL